MNLDDLIEALEDMRDSNPDGGDMDVRIAQQQSYPLEGKLVNVRVLKRNPERNQENEGAPAVYLASGAATNYCTKRAWDQPEDEAYVCVDCKREYDGDIEECPACGEEVVHSSEL